VRSQVESSIISSFDTDFYRRVKARYPIEPWRGVQERAFTPALILFIALPEAEDKTDPG